MKRHVIKPKRVFMQEIIRDDICKTPTHWRIFSRLRFNLLQYSSIRYQAIYIKTLCLKTGPGNTTVNCQVIVSQNQQRKAHLGRHKLGFIGGKMLGESLRSLYERDLSFDTRDPVFSLLVNNAEIQLLAPEGIFWLQMIVVSLWSEQREL